MQDWTKDFLFQQLIKTDSKILFLQIMAKYIFERISHKKGLTFQNTKSKVRQWLKELYLCLIVQKDLNPFLWLLPTQKSDLMENPFEFQPPTANNM